MDNRKIILASYIGTALLVWWYARRIVQYLYVNFYQLRRALSGMDVVRDAIPIVVGATAFGILYKNKKVNAFVEEVVAEIRKVTWPTKDDVVRSTIVVIVCIALASMVLAVFDVGWGKIMSMLLA